VRDAGNRSWIDAFRSAVNWSQHEKCDALLAVRQELPVPFAIEFADEAGEYLARMSRYDDAEHELSIAASFWSEKIGEEDAENWLCKGNALQRWAALRARRSDHAGAEEKYGAAVAAYERALALAPNHVEALNNKGTALQRWAQMKLAAGEAGSAVSLFGCSSKSCLAALEISPNPYSYRILAMNFVLLCPLFVSAPVRAALFPTVDMTAEPVVGAEGYSGLRSREMGTLTTGVGAVIATGSF
jgi:tetratricopeptide (TPR) repeat protein